MRAFSNCSAVILGGTQLAFEAMLIGVTPIVYQPRSNYVATNFEPFSKWCFVAYNLEQIMHLIDAVSNNTHEYISKRNKWDELLFRQFGQGFEFSWDVFIQQIASF